MQKVLSNLGEALLLILKDARDKKPTDEELYENIPEIEEGIRANVLSDIPHWKKIKDATTKRTDEDDCVTTEKMLLEGWIDDEDYRIIEPLVMVNREMYCIPIKELKKLPFDE